MILIALIFRAEREESPPGFYSFSEIICTAGCYKHGQAEPVNEDNTFCVTGGKW